ncbi:hypothetical protein BD289DRAFT_87510 [Coniella lustricola]|uniref:Uncharacterized protein n=1 Tax=Coniella lustricola TaxID=2025994 RepID=A0A2T2ZYP3_9PEZI|nr:hypothetical protein BD289DRAFT_87510 [Coniella lustricola]
MHTRSTKKEGNKTHKTSDKSSNSGQYDHRPALLRLVDAWIANLPEDMEERSAGIQGEEQSRMAVIEESERLARIVRSVRRVVRAWKRGERRGGCDTGDDGDDDGRCGRGVDSQYHHYHSQKQHQQEHDQIQSANDYDSNDGQDNVQGKDQRTAAIVPHIVSMPNDNTVPPTQRPNEASCPFTEQHNQSSCYNDDDNNYMLTNEIDEQLDAWTGDFGEPFEDAELLLDSSSFTDPYGSRSGARESQSSEPSPSAVCWQRVLDSPDRSTTVFVPLWVHEYRRQQQQRQRQQHGYGYCRDHVESPHVSQFLVMADVDDEADGSEEVRKESSSSSSNNNNINNQNDNGPFHRPQTYTDTTNDSRSSTASCVDTIDELLDSYRHTGYVLQKEYYGGFAGEMQGSAVTAGGDGSKSIETRVNTFCT